MTFLDWLSTPAGIEFAHAVTILITSAAAYLSFRAHQHAKAADQKVDGHMWFHRQEMIDRAASQASGGQPPDQPTA